MLGQLHLNAPARYLEKLCGTLAAGQLEVGSAFPARCCHPSLRPPPPLVLPEVTFTDVTVYPAGLFGAQLEVPGLRLAAGSG
ncbi:MAG: hypothetical protein ACRDSZ_07085 [Pseudonocardiaceae bacterium]